MAAGPGAERLAITNTFLQEYKCKTAIGFKATSDALQLSLESTLDDFNKAESTAGAILFDGFRACMSRFLMVALVGEILRQIGGTGRCSKRKELDLIDCHAHYVDTTVTTTIGETRFAAQVLHIKEGCAVQCVER